MQYIEQNPIVERHLQSFAEAEPKDILDLPAWDLPAHDWLIESAAACAGASVEEVADWPRPQQLLGWLLRQPETIRGSMPIREGPDMVMVEGIYPLAPLPPGKPIMELVLECSSPHQRTDAQVADAARRVLDLQEPVGIWVRLIDPVDPSIMETFYVMDFMKNKFAYHGFGQEAPHADREALAMALLEDANIWTMLKHLRTRPV